MFLIYKEIFNYFFQNCVKKKTGWMDFKKLFTVKLPMAEKKKNLCSLCSLRHALLVMSIR